MTARKSVLILGGGVGGLVVARKLRKRLDPDDRIVVIDRREHHLFQASLLWLMTGDREPDQIRRPLDRLARHGVEFLQGEIEAIDPAERTVRVDGTTHSGDALVVSLGAELAADEVPGLAEGGHNLYTLEGAGTLRDTLDRLDGGRIAVVTATPAYKCPAAPYEAAMLIEDVCRQRGIRDRIEIDFHAAEPGPLGVAGPEVSAGVQEMLEARGIGYHPERQLRGVDPDSRTLRFSGDTTADYDLLAYVPPHRAPTVVRDAGLVDESGWVPVDRRTLETSFPSVFAVGDVTHIPLGLGKPLPKAGVFAHEQAKVVARNLADAWAGRNPGAEFDGHGWCILETGAGRAGIGKGDFYAEPTPDVELRGPGRLWHWAKVAYEKWWLWKWL